MFLRAEENRDKLNLSQLSLRVRSSASPLLVLGISPMDFELSIPCSKGAWIFKELLSMWEGSLLAELWE